MLDFSGLRNQNAQAKVGKSQKQIAADLGIGATRYSAIVKGRVEPTTKEIEKMCKGFKCEVGDLLEYKE